MATIKEIIERVDDTKPNAFAQKTKMAWIAELDGKIAIDVMLMNIVEARRLQYTHPADLTSEPLVGFPHDTIYDLWLGAKIDFENGEYNKYQNSMEQFNAHYGNFVRWFASAYEPAQGYATPGFENPPYYITAFGLAVMRGYKGTLDEWLTSLQGPKGDRVELRNQEGMIQWRWIQDTEATEMATGDWQDLLDLSAIGGGGGGASGEDGATFTPHVDADGTLSWTNDKGLENPAAVNIKGDRGEQGEPGAVGAPGADGHTPVKGVDYYTEEEQETMVEEVLDKLPVVSKVDFTNFENGSFTETVDGEVITHTVTFDDSGRPVKIDNVAITWGDS